MEDATHSMLCDLYEQHFTEELLERLRKEEATLLSPPCFKGSWGA